MISDFLAQQITSQLPYTPNEQQTLLIKELGQFLASHDPNKLFLLKGYAGTGKTTIVSALVGALSTLKQTTILLAPTGRAAKVIANYSHHPAYTIHKKIYRQQELGTEKFNLADNLYKNALFIVDEASMIANISNDSTPFGTGRLLDDLINYVYSGDHCAMLLLGDNAQLPPVGQQFSPALERTKLESYGLKVSEFQLTKVARQEQQSGILANATMLRQMLADNKTTQLPRLQYADDIQLLEGTQVVEQIEKSYQEVGAEETLIITRTNYQTNQFNQGIRGQILWKEDQISNGDRIMVVKNNYHWTKDYDNIEFLANGDIFEIKRISNIRELYGFHFANASLKAIDYDWEIEAILWLDTMQTNTPEENYPLQQKLFNQIAEDYPEIHNKQELIKKIYENDYYNALQIRFAYAVTCHKAQGGQWKNIFINTGNLTDEQINTDYYRWLYTAITRATKQVYMINYNQK
ncbi:MAG: AAA family ATPase [Paludibacteraceae bacterium]|nr:AAA family ATPase [Paludibacteraceae bacterium]